VCIEITDPETKRIPVNLQHAWHYRAARTAAPCRCIMFCGYHLRTVSPPTQWFCEDSYHEYANRKSVETRVSVDEMADYMLVSDHNYSDDDVRYGIGTVLTEGNKMILYDHVARYDGVDEDDDEYRREEVYYTRRVCQEFAQDLPLGQIHPIWGLQTPGEEWDFDTRYNDAKTYTNNKRVLVVELDEEKKTARFTIGIRMLLQMINTDRIHNAAAKEERWPQHIKKRSMATFIKGIIPGVVDEEARAAAAAAARMRAIALSKLPSALNLISQLMQTETLVIDPEDRRAFKAVYHKYINTYGPCPDMITQINVILAKYGMTYDSTVSDLVVIRNSLTKIE